MKKLLLFLFLTLILFASKSQAQEAMISFGGSYQENYNVWIEERHSKTGFELSYQIAFANHWAVAANLSYHTGNQFNHLNPDKLYKTTMGGLELEGRFYPKHKLNGPYIGLGLGAKALDVYYFEPEPDKYVWTDFFVGIRLGNQSTIYDNLTLEPFIYIGGDVFDWNEYLLTARAGLLVGYRF